MTRNPDRKTTRIQQSLLLRNTPGCSHPVARSVLPCMFLSASTTSEESTGTLPQSGGRLLSVDPVLRLCYAASCYRTPQTVHVGYRLLCVICVCVRAGGVLAQAGDENILGSALTYPVGYNGLTFAALGELPYARLQEARASGDAVVASYLIGNAGRTLALVRNRICKQHANPCCKGTA